MSSNRQRYRYRPIIKFIAAGAFALSLIFAGVLIVLELNKGTLTIECDADDVPIRIMQGEDTFERLTISKQGITTRMKAGNYTIEVDGESNAYEIRGENVTLKRGQETIAKVSLTDHANDPIHATETLAQHLQGQWRVALREYPPGIEIYDDEKPEYQIEGDRLTAILDLGEKKALGAVYRFTVDGNQSPPHLGLRSDAGYSVGLINVEGDRLRICLRRSNNGELGTVRPSKLGPGQDVIYEEWERMSDGNGIVAPAQASHQEPARDAMNDEETPDFILLGLSSSQRNAHRELIARCVIKMPEGSMVQHFFRSDADKPLLQTPLYTPILSSAIYYVRHENPVTFRVTKILQHAGQSIFAEFQVADLSPTIAAELKGHGDFEIEVTDADVGHIATGKRVTKVLLWSPIRGARIDISVLAGNEPPLVAVSIAQESETVIAVLQLSDEMLPKRPSESKQVEIAPNEARAWQQTDLYVAPNFADFFPDDKDGGLALDALWNAADKDSRSDAEILKTVREGFRNTQQHRMPILRWIGNKYIWNKSPQNPDAIELMYHTADFSGENANPSGTRHDAVYFGLSVTQPKTPAILRTLAELSMRVDDPNDLDRIAWGCSNQKDELLEYLKPFEASDDEAVRIKADVCRRIFRGELRAFAWAAEQARQRAEKTYSSQLPQFKETLMYGSSEERLEALQTILKHRIALIMDDSFVVAFAKCAEDQDPQVRKQTTIIAGAKWVWETQEQNPEAIELMLKLSKDDHRDVRYNAVYYGLSTVRNKSDDVIRRLLEMAFKDREWNLLHRIEWGLRDDRERVATLLTEYINGADEVQAKAACEVFKELTGG